MKIIAKVCLKVVSILLIVILLLFSFSNYFRPNKLARPSDMTSKVDGFYELEDNSMDVLLFGTSHMFYSFNPSILWKNTGLNSYIFAGECQQIEITLQFMKEAIRTQNPSLIVLDVFGLSNSIESCRTEGSSKVNTEDLKLNRNKIDAIETYDDEVGKNVFDIYKYHNRLFSMQQKDFKNGMLKFDNTNFGYALAYPYNQYDSNYVYVENNQIIEPDEAKLNALNEIIELCKGNQIELLLVKTPYYASEDDAQIYKYMENYAFDKDISYVNFNQMYDEINYHFDYDGSTWHANVIGALKITNYLSDYIVSNYEFTNSNQMYDKEYNELYIKTEYALLNKITDFKDWYDLTREIDATVIMNYKVSDGIWLPKERINILKELGLDFDKLDQNQLIILSVEKESFLSYDYQEYKKKINEHEVIVNSEGELIIDDVVMNSPEADITISVIDNSSGYLIDTFSLVTQGDTYILRK
ncbi:MAG: hypothetical protein RR945_01655 [Erysipelotrichaceae bacterium]